jgi:NADP-dependent alcohol dehydrogenase
MKNFEFYNPVKVIFGKDQLTKLSKLIPKEKKILMLYGGGSIKKNGVYDQVTEILKGYTVVEFSGIEPNPHYETAMKAVELIKKEKIDFLLAIGGGSVIDASKFIAAAALYTAGDPWDIMSKGAKVEAALPLGVILTLPATGTEMNANSVVTRVSTNEKFSFNSPQVYPKFSFLLPDAAGFLPRNQVANGVVDAFVHVIEQYLTYPVNAPLQDRMAESILQTLVEIGPIVYNDPADYDAMSNLMWCATMALNGLISCGVPGDWAVHTIGHELTAIHNIDHARTLAIVLPGVWSVLKEEKKEKLLQYGARVWGVTTGSDNERIENTILKTVEFFESLGIKTRMEDYNVTIYTIDKIVKRFEERGWKTIGDRDLITPDVVRQVLEHQLVSR